MENASGRKVEMVDRRKVVRDSIITKCVSQSEHWQSVETRRHCPYCGVLYWDSRNTIYVCMRNTPIKGGQLKETPRILKIDALPAGEKVKIPDWCPLPDAPESP